MKHQAEILAQLRAAGARGISGQTLAKHLGVSRTAVWKAVKSLQKAGYGITAGPNRGYCLVEDRDRLSADELTALLPGLEIIVLDSVDSTNNEAKRRLVAGQQNPLLVTAESQTAGRGRQGKSFYSPDGTGVYLTLVVHPNAPILDAVSVTTRASVAVCRAIRGICPAEPEVKWVNDLYLNGKKICGILVEAVSDFETGITKSLVIGVGVNVSTSVFPDDLPDAASLAMPGITRNRLIAEIVRELQRETADLQDRSYLDDYRRWSLVLGKDIRYSRNDGTFFARAVEIDDNGGLIVEDAQGSRTTLQSGEISLRLR